MADEAETGSACDVRSTVADEGGASEPRSLICMEDVDEGGTTATATPGGRSSGAQKKSPPLSSLDKKKSRFDSKEHCQLSATGTEPDTQAQTVRAQLPASVGQPSLGNAAAGDASMTKGKESQQREPQDSTQPPGASDANVGGRREGSAEVAASQSHVSQSPVHGGFPDTASDNGDKDSQAVPAADENAEEPKEAASRSTSGPPTNSSSLTLRPDPVQGRRPAHLTPPPQSVILGTSTPIPGRLTPAFRMQQDFYFPDLDTQFIRRLRDSYNVLEKIGEGSYGSVFVGKCLKTQNKCALKVMKLDQHQEGFPLTSVREINIATMFAGVRNIAHMREILMSEEKNAVLVFDYVDYDLAGILLSNFQLPLRHIKSLFFQILNGLAILHRGRIVHRDIKASNVLVDKDGIAKLCDFGLSRQISDGDRRTRNVVTMWYRPPELLLGDVYDSKIDVWSAGCLLAEMFRNEPLFRGRDQETQLQYITELCGTPNESNWPNVGKLERYVTIRDDKPRKLVPVLKQLCSAKRRNMDKPDREIPDTALDLLDWMLTLDPSKRPSVKEAMDHRFFYYQNDVFTDSPKPVPLLIPGWAECHEWQVKRARHARDHHKGHGKGPRGGPQAAGESAHKGQKGMPSSAKGTRSGKGGSDAAQKGSKGGKPPANTSGKPSGKPSGRFDPGGGKAGLGSGKQSGALNMGKPNAPSDNRGEKGNRGRTQATKADRPAEGGKGAPGRGQKRPRTQSSSGPPPKMKKTGPGGGKPSNTGSSAIIMNEVLTSKELAAVQQQIARSSSASSANNKK